MAVPSEVPVFRVGPLTRDEAKKLKRGYPHLLNEGPCECVWPGATVVAQMAAYCALGTEEDALFEQARATTVAAEARPPTLYTRRRRLQRQRRDSDDDDESPPPRAKRPRTIEAAIVKDEEEEILQSVDMVAEDDDAAVQGIRASLEQVQAQLATLAQRRAELDAQLAHVATAEQLAAAEDAAWKTHLAHTRHVDDLYARNALSDATAASRALVAATQAYHAAAEARAQAAALRRERDVTLPGQLQAAEARRQRLAAALAVLVPSS